MDAGSRPDFSMAWWPASIDSDAVLPPARRSWMPVRSWIHASLVSIMAARSSLVMTVSGTAVPHPVITPPRRPRGTGGTSGRPQPGDRLARRDALALHRQERFEHAHERRPHVLSSHAAEDLPGVDGGALRRS